MIKRSKYYLISYTFKNGSGSTLTESWIKSWNVFKKPRPNLAEIEKIKETEPRIKGTVFVNNCLEISKQQYLELKQCREGSNE